MSNPLQDSIQSMISSSIQSNRTGMMTEIIRYDHQAKTIDVVPIGASGGKSAETDHTKGLIEKISVMYSRAIKDEGIQPGDRAYIEFVDSTLTTAVATTIIKQEVNEDTDRTGATLLKPLSTQAPPVWEKGWE